MAGGLKDFDLNPSHINTISFRNGCACEPSLPVNIACIVNVFPSHPFCGTPAELVDGLDGLFHFEDLPGPGRGKDLQIRDALFEKGNDPHMIEVGMEDEEFCDLFFVNGECLELPEEIRDHIAHTSAYNHGLPFSLKDIDA